MAPQSVFRSDLFAGKVAVVTGGGSGIGKAIARELIELGARVVIAARKESRLLETAAELGSEDQVASTLCNIRDEDQVRAMLQFALDRFGAIDFLVNNAGGQFPSPAGLVRTKGWNAVIETNLTGTFLCCREVFGLWMEEHGGVIVNIIADMFRGFPGMVHTGAARAGVDNIQDPRSRVGTPGNPDQFSSAWDDP